MISNAGRGDHGVDEDIQGASTVTGHAEIDDAGLHLPVLAGADTDQARLAVLEGLFGSIEHRWLRATAADPADQFAVGGDQGLGPRLGGGGRFTTHHGRQHKGRTAGLEFLRLVQHRIAVQHPSSSRFRQSSVSTGSRACRLCRLCAGANRSSCGSAACMPWVLGS